MILGSNKAHGCDISIKLLRLCGKSTIKPLKLIFAEERKPKRQEERRYWSDSQKRKTKIMSDMSDRTNTDQ